MRYRHALPGKARCGGAGRCSAWRCLALRGAAWPCVALLGTDGLGWAEHGAALLGEARHGVARPYRAMLVKARVVARTDKEAMQYPVVNSSRGPGAAVRGGAGHGPAWRDCARLGIAWQCKEEQGKEISLAPMFSSAMLVLVISAYPPLVRVLSQR